MFSSEKFQSKWTPVLDHPDLPKITDPHRRAVTAVILENQEKAFREEAGILNEATPTNVATTGGFGSGASAPQAGYDPILISLIRRALPNLMAYDIAGVQPMNGPTGLIFAMRSTYKQQTFSGPSGLDNEAFYNEANTAFSGVAGGVHTSLGIVNPADGTNFLLANTTAGIPTTTAEGNINAEMGFSIEKVTVTAKTRQLKASYSIELAQDLKAVHGLDAETELSNILSTEILAEINREVVRSVYAIAKVGGPSDSGAMNLNSTTVADGRWQVEKFKNLIFAIERDANKIARETRRGKGNIIICSADVASALALSGLLDYNSGLTGQTNLEVDATGNTFAGTLFGRIKVYIDPYSVSSYDYVVTGYKGSAIYDAGVFYCPYVPLQMVRAIDPDSFQPRIGFKTRYGMVMNPFAKGGTGPDSTGSLADNSNVYYRKFVITNLK